MEYSFSIEGNQENPNGNAIPYKRTLNHSWRPDSMRYHKWQEYVVASSGLQYVMDPKKLKMLPPIFIPKGHKAFMDIMIYHADETHGDPDNIFKGIADALFQNDKKVAGHFDFAMSPHKRGRVDVHIRVFPLVIT